jgi:hypothetical protein
MTIDAKIPRSVICFLIFLPFGFVEGQQRPILCPTLGWCQ